MDSALVLASDGVLWVREGRRVRKGDQVAIGEAEDGREGIYVHATAFLEEVGSDGEFKFMVSEVSREKPIDYALMAKILVDEREGGGYPIWVAVEGFASVADHHSVVRVFPDRVPITLEHLDTIDRHFPRLRRDALLRDVQKLPQHEAIRARADADI